MFESFKIKSLKLTMMRAGVLAAIVAGCTSLSDSTSRLELTHDALVTIGNEPAAEKKKGEMINLNGSTPVLIESVGKISVLALPSTNYATHTKINLRNTDRAYTQGSQARFETELSEVISQLNEVQVLLSANRGKEALTVVQLLQQKYPKIDHLRVVEASCLIVMGKRHRAIQLLSDLKTEYPHDMGILSFYQSLVQSSGSNRGIAEEAQPHGKQEEEKK